MSNQVVSDGKVLLLWKGEIISVPEISLNSSIEKDL
jgi:hypothetical protein